MSMLSSPFTGPPPKDIPLARPPLVRVLTQIRFPIIALIGKQDFIAPFQESIRADYPDVQADQSSALTVGPSGLSLHPQTIWRFSTFDKRVIVSLGSGFVSLEVAEYQGKDHFLKLLAPVLESVEAVFKPARVERIGLRYINRFKGGDLANLKDYIRPEVLGILYSNVGQSLKHSVTETVVDIDGKNSSILARWGLLDSGLTHDPAAMPAIAEKSWILDIDAFSDYAEAFSAQALGERLDGLADADYRFFRWVTTAACLRYFGGAV
jgi:uncharacterized protein (TIGR04255 family)